MKNQRISRKVIFGIAMTLLILNTTTAIRLVLDKAATTEEAIKLLQQYNIYFSGDVTCHYLISDANGYSVIVEYYDGVLDEDKAIALLAEIGVMDGETDKWQNNHIY